MKKGTVLIIVGFIILLISATLPLPMMLGLSGIVWRVLLALLGIALIFLLTKSSEKDPI